MDQQTNHGMLSTLVDSLLDDFELAWRGTEPPRIDEFLARVMQPGRPMRQQCALLQKLVAVDLEYRFRKWGSEAPDNAPTLALQLSDCNSPRLEDYRPLLERHVGSPAAWPPRLFLDEYQIRCRFGDRPLLDDYPERFPEIPDWPDRLREMESSTALEPAGSAVGNYTGTILAGDYELLREIARGGMGVVYEAHQRSLKRIVAVKMILAGQLASEASLRRFQAEARAAAGLNHPHIVPVYEVGQDRGQHFFSMGYVDGANLAERVTQFGPVPPQEAARLIEQVAGAVHYAHRRGIVHRDMKPQNVLLTKDGRPMVTDFGLAKHADHQDGLTVTGQFVGTPSFMAPEQAHGRLDEIGPLSDVYGLGAVLYYLLTGRPPFHTGSIAETLKQVIECEPVSPRRLNPEISRDLETICLKCLEKEASKRYASAQDVADDLGRFLSGDNILARPISRLEQAWRWCRRQPSTAALLVVTALLFLIGVPLTLWYQGQLTASRALAKAAQSDLRLAEQTALASRESARSHEYNAALNQARQEIAAARPGWTQRVLAKVEDAAGLETAARNVVELRTEAARALLGIDVLPRPELITGLQASSLAFSPDGRTLAVGQFKAWVWVPCTVQLVDVASGETRQSLSFIGSAVVHKGRPVQDGCRQLVFSPDARWLAVGARSGWVHVWDLAESPAKLVSWRAHEEELCGLLFSTDSKRLYSAGKEDKTVTCSEYSDDKTWRQTATQVLGGDVHEISMHASGKHLLVEESPKLITSLAADSLAILDRQERLRGSMYCAPWGQSVLLGQDWGLEVYDTASRQTLRNYYDPTTANGDLWSFEKAQFSHDEALLTTVGNTDRRIRLWDANSGKVLFAAVLETHLPMDAALSPDGRQLAILGEHRVQLFDVAGDLGRAHFSGRVGLPTAMEWGPSPPMAMELLDPAAPRPPLEFMAHEGASLVASYAWRSALAVHSPTKQIAESQPDDKTCIWDLSGPAPRPLAERPLPKVSQLEFTADGRRLWLICEKEQLWLWEPTQTEPEMRFSAAIGNALTGRSDLNCLAVGREFVLVGSRLGQLLMFSGEERSPVRWNLDAGPLISLSLSTEEDLAVCGTESGMVRAVKVPAGKLLPPLARHNDAVSSLAFSPDGRLLASTSLDRTLRLWARNADEFQELLTLHFSAAVLEACFHPECNKLAIRVQGETFVRLLPLDKLEASLASLGLGWSQRPPPPDDP